MNAAPNSTALTFWLRAMAEAMGRGGKTEAAEKLGITPSGLSKLLHDPTRAFDEKTCRALAWVQESKAERYSQAEFPLEKEEVFGSIVVETRINPGPGGGQFYLWRKAE